MAPVIYTSTLVAEPLVKRSIFTHLFSSNDTNTIGGFPACTPAYTDAATGITLTRGQTKQLALSLAYGLKNQRSTSIHAKRGDAVIVYSSNSLAWPVVLLGTSQRLTLCPLLPCHTDMFSSRVVSCRRAALQPRQQCIQRSRTNVSVHRQRREVDLLQREWCCCCARGAGQYRAEQDRSGPAHYRHK